MKKVAFYMASKNHSDVEINKFINEADKWSKANNCDYLVFFDFIDSGFDVSNRKSLNELKRCIIINNQFSKVSKVVVKSVKDISRDLSFNVNFLTFLDQHHCKIEDFDGNDLSLVKIQKQKLFPKDSVEYKILKYKNNDECIYVNYLIKNNAGNSANCWLALDNKKLKTLDDYTINEGVRKQIKANNQLEFSYPKTSELHDITYKLYQMVCNIEKNMLYLDEDELEELNMCPELFDLLCEDISRFHLEDYFEQRGENLIVYNGLQCLFNDNKKERRHDLER